MKAEYPMTRPETPPTGIKELIDAIFWAEMVSAGPEIDYRSGPGLEYWEHVEVILDELGITPEEAAQRIKSLRKAKPAPKVAGA